MGFQCAKSLTRIYYTMSQLKARCIHEDFAAKRKKGNLNY